MTSVPVWLSETKVLNAKSVIIVGHIDQQSMNECLKKYPLGFFLVSHVDTQPLADPNFFQISPHSDKKKFISSIANFLLLDTQSPPEVKVASSVQDYETPLYEELIQIILTEIDSLLRARKTRKETGYTRQLQIFSNLDGYLLARIPEEWKDLGREKLAIVVGSGPSLDITLEHIKKGLPCPIIVATDSSLKALAKEKISPHFVISIDPDKSVDACSQAGITPGIAILSSQSHPSWSNAWPNKCFISGRVITEDWLAEKGVGKTSLLAINNAGLTALAVADFFNPAAILLVGMDLAGSGDGSIRYAQNTGRSNIEINASIFHEIPGNFDQTVPTPFFSDWKETSDACSNFSRKRSIINLNDRGAALEGASLIHPNDFEEIKKLLSENISPLNSMEIKHLDKRRSIHGFGLVQVLTLLTTKCDQIWNALEHEKKASDSSEFFRNILSDKDTASLLGDFAFSIMPRLTNQEDITLLDSEIDKLRNLIWKMEDGILNCNPSDEFISRFLTEKFS